MNNDVDKNLYINIKSNESLFIKFISDRLGIIIPSYQTHDLDKTIYEACNKFHCSPKEYLKILTDCYDESPVLEHLVSRITIGETYFFRDQHQMKMLQEVILPNLINMKRKQNNLSLRIWSAGCATGEEIYTLAMLLYELIPDINDWTLKLLATDINSISLQKALVGRYSEWSMRSISEYYKKAYFTLDNRHYQLSKKVLDLVNFDYLNLNDNNYPSMFNGTNAQDLILCRNVFIYFDSGSINSIMKKFNASLIPGGYLILGASDPIDITETDFTFHHEKGLLLSRPTESVPNVQVKANMDHYVIKNDKTISKPIKPKLPNIVAPKKVAHVTVVSPSEDQINHLLNLSQWQEVVDTVNKYEYAGNKSTFLINAKATALANLGKLNEAILLCEESCRLDSTNKYTYFTYALILSELNRLSEAEAALRKTLFLDSQFVIGHFQLGLLLIKLQQHNNGMKYLRNALKIVELKDSEKNVPGSQGLTYGSLTEILKHEIDLYIALGNKNHANKKTENQKE